MSFHLILLKLWLAFILTKKTIIILFQDGMIAGLIRLLVVLFFWDTSMMGMFPYMAMPLRVMLFFVCLWAGHCVFPYFALQVFSKE